MVIKTHEPFFQYYRKVFVPAYSDLVGYEPLDGSGFSKPEEVLLGIENSFSHINQFFNNNLSIEKKEENLNKALHHLERLTLDCYKLLWIKIQSDVTEFIKDPKIREFCIKVQEHEFMSQYQTFLKLAKEARIFEMSNVGVDVNTSTISYKKANDAGKKLRNMINLEKIEQYKDLNKKKQRRATCIYALKLFAICIFAAITISLLDEYVIVPFFLRGS